MTREERMALLPHVPDGVLTVWRDVNPTHVALKAHPCPFYLFKTCTVYEVRPYNCRRFGCMRPDPKTEPFEESPKGILGCANLGDRIRMSRVARRMGELMQRKAQRWARRHGWAI